jgi:hypothetical protein
MNTITNSSSIVATATSDATRARRWCGHCGADLPPRAKLCPVCLARDPRMHVLQQATMPTPPAALVATWRRGGIQALAKSRGIDLTEAFDLLRRYGVIARRCKITTEQMLWLLENHDTPSRAAAIVLGVSHQTVIRWRRLLTGATR